MSAPLCAHCGSPALTRERAAPSRAFCGRECQVAAYALIEGKRTISDTETTVILVCGDGTRIETEKALLQYSGTLKSVLEATNTQEIELPREITKNAMDFVLVLVNAWHTLPNKADADLSEIFALATQGARHQINTVDEALAVVFAINYLEISGIGAMEFVFDKLWPHLIISNASRVFLALSPDLLGLFLITCTTHAVIDQTLSAVCQGIADILVGPVSARRHKAAISKFLSSDLADTLRIARCVIGEIEDNTDAFAMIIDSCIDLRLELSVFLSTRYSPYFILWLIDTHFGRISKVSQFVIDLLVGAPSQYAHVLYRSTNLPKLHIAQHYISKRHALNAVDIFGRGYAFIFDEFFRSIFLRMTPQFSDAIEKLVVWTIEMYPDQFSCIDAIRVLVGDIPSSPTAEHAERVRLVKLLSTKL